MNWYDFSSTMANIKNDLNLDDDILLLDFGHSGSDSGCIFYDKTYEKDYVLDFGLRLYKLLKPFFKKIYLTRTNDNTVNLAARSKKMNEIAKKCKTLHVYSIHCNANNTITNGAEALISITADKTSSDYIFLTEFLKQYCKVFGLNNRGIVQRKGNNGDYYHIIRETSKNCKVKILELFFGDNREDCKKGQTEDFKDKASFFVASSILKRYGMKIDKPEATRSNIIYTVQAGAFDNHDNALKLQNQLKKKGFESIIKAQKKIN